MAKGKKTGGRQAGTPNKDKQPLLDALRERFPDYHPVLAMAEIANDEEAPRELRFQAHKEVSQYIEPKRKALEVSQGKGEPFVFNMVFDG
ncbi:MAG: hypothetical protein B6D73_15185 [gamma proteobacterium symbiont of Stewartia floridana]|nr:MAG: hypothetical protein B6D73_15185 [gamma proteobacterium symbiont of Stewartia floridana]